MRTSTWALLAVVLVASACDKSEKPAPAGETKSGGSAAGTPAASAASDDGEGIATEEDFEDEAEQKINPQNADEELDKLEKEIAN